MRGTIPISVEQGERGLTRWDALAVLLTLGLLVFVAEASRHLLQPLAELQLAPLSLAPENLPEYAARRSKAIVCLKYGGWKMVTKPLSSAEAECLRS